MTEKKIEILLAGVTKAFEGKRAYPMAKYNGDVIEFFVHVYCDQILDPSEVGDLCLEIDRAADAVEHLDDLKLKVEKAVEAISERETDYLVRTVVKLAKVNEYRAIKTLLDF